MTPNTWKALLSVAAKKNIRHYLNGIFIDAHKRVAVATNGHVLIVCKLDKDDVVDANAIIPRDLVESAVKLKDCKLRIAGDSTINMGQLSAKPIDGRYPDWIRVIPETTSGEVGYYDWDYLSIINEAGRLITGRKQFNMWLRMNGDSAALVVLGYTALAVIMPMRTSIEQINNEPKQLADMQALIRA